jgi:hypothetical protein
LLITRIEEKKAEAGEKLGYLLREARAQKGL